MTAKFTGRLVYSVAAPWPQWHSASPSFKARPVTGLLHHSDQGSQYAARQYRERLAQLGFTASMSRKGNAWDNAVVESFFSNLKNELTHNRTFQTREQARSEIFDYIEIFYNRQRAHATLQYMSPEDYESMSNGAQLNRPANPG